MLSRRFRRDERAVTRDPSIAKDLVSVADATAGYYKAEAYVDKLVTPGRTILSSAQGRTQAENQRDFPAYYGNKTAAQLANDRAVEINQENQIPN